MSGIDNIGGGGSGNVVGAASSTADAVALFSGTTGKVLKNSVVTIDGSGNIALPPGAFVSFGISSALYANTLGPRWEDGNTGNLFTINVSGLTNNRTVEVPDASGIMTLGGNTFNGTGNIARTTSAAFVTPTLGVATATSVQLTGGLTFLGFTSAAGDATTTELPADKNCALHKNTGSGVVSLAFNDGGVIKTVALA